MPVLDPDTGDTMEYRQLRRYPKYIYIWKTSYFNELGRLFQGIVRGDKGPKKQRVAGTETFQFIGYEDIPRYFCMEVCHTKVVCEVCPPKEDPDRKSIMIGGNRIIYPWEFGTSTMSLELVKLILNSVISRPVGGFACFDVKNFYLAPPMERSEYVHIKIGDIPQGFIHEYNLLPMVHNGWIYFDLFRG